MRPWVRIPIASSTTSAPEPLQSNGTRIGRFLPTACQLHLKSSIFEAAVRHLRDHGIAFFLGPTETKSLSLGGLSRSRWKPVGDSQAKVNRAGSISFLNFRIDRKGPLLHTMAP